MRGAHVIVEQTTHRIKSAPFVNKPQSFLAIIGFNDQSLSPLTTTAIEWEGNAFP